ncbi:hypothetical protein SUDANB25_05766 [Streptomyces sp. SudanB25_2051]
MRQPPSGIAHPCAFRPAARRRAAGTTRERMQPQVPRSPRRPLPPRHAGNGPSRRDGRPPHVLTRPGCRGVRPAVGAAARRLSRRPRPAARPTPRTGEVRRPSEPLTRRPTAETTEYLRNPHAGRGVGEGNMAGKPPGDDRLRRGHPGRRPDFPAPPPVARSRHSAHAVPPRHALHRSRPARGRQADGRPDGRPPDARRIGSDRTVERAPRGLLRGTAHGVLVPSLRQPEREALPVPPLDTRCAPPHAGGHWGLLLPVQALTTWYGVSTAISGHDRERCRVCLRSNPNRCKGCVCP